jgi:hypothetical protein
MNKIKDSLAIAVREKWQDSRIEIDKKVPEARMYVESAILLGLQEDLAKKVCLPFPHFKYKHKFPNSSSVYFRQAVREVLKNEYNCASEPLDRSVLQITIDASEQLPLSPPVLMRQKGYRRMLAQQQQQQEPEGGNSV